MSKSRILLVEDNAINRRLVRDILVYRGHEVVEAATASEARTCLAAGRPDLVVMDLQIPGGDGESLMKEMRRDPGRADIPVVVVTAAGMAGDRDRLLQAGFDAYVGKPIDTRSFGPLLESLISKAKAGANRD